MADNFRFFQGQPYSLSGSGALIGDTSITLKSMKDIDGNSLSMATDFGSIGFGTLEPGNGANEEQICFTGLTNNANGTTTLTGVSSVSFAYPYTRTSGLLKTHAGATTFIISNTSGFYDELTSKADDETITGTWTFTNPNYPRMDSATPLPTDDAQFATKKYVDGVAIAGAPDASTTTKGIVKMSTAPVSPTSPIAVGDNDYRLNPNNYAADAGSNDTYVITLSNVPASYVTGQKFVFKANTANTGTATLNVNSLGAKTIVRSDGTTLLTGDILANQIVEVIYNGTDMVMTSAPAGTANLVAGAYPAGDGINITGVALKKESYTASGAITQNDTVYVSAANTVKSLYPSAMTTAASISTGPDHTVGLVFMPLSTSGNYLSFSGGVMSVSGILYAQVRTINAGETNFSNGTEAIVYNTGNGVRAYSVTQISTDKFLIIFQADTAGNAAGIKAVVVSVSGTTVTVGSVVTIESTGTLNYRPSVAKVDTDKGIIFYKKDSDNKLYCQVLTVSTTTITTNTPVVVDNTNTNPIITIAEQLSTNSVISLYNFNGTTVYGNTITVSGTTPTVAAQQSVLTIASANTWYMSVKAISSTKLFFVYSTAGSSTNDTCKFLTVSGATITGGSTLALASDRQTEMFPIVLIGTKYLLVSDYSSSTSYTINFLDITGTTPVSISTQSCGQGTISGVITNIGMVKISPWTYTVSGSGSSDADYIFKLTPASSARLGLAESDIADTASGYILNRYIPQTVSNITLTPGSFYYTDDTGQPTLNSSLTAPTIGVAISTNKILLQ